MTLAIEVGLKKYDIFMPPTLNSIDCQRFKSYGNTFKCGFAFLFNCQKKIKYINH